MPQTSAGILLYRKSPELQVLLVHPGGPFFARKDDGVWSLPKGEYEEGEEPLRAALRELAEETGLRLDAGSDSVIDLGRVRYKNGKEVRAYALPGDFDPEGLVSATFELEWPPRSGQKQEFPEVDRAAWFSLEEARVKLTPAQTELIDRLEAELNE